MTRRLPLIPTILVLAAAATMVALGVWQLGHAQEKADLIARYSDASAIGDSVAFPLEGEGEDAWFRRSSLTCAPSPIVEPVSGTAWNGAKGWAMRAGCVTEAGARVPVDLGFSQDLAPPQWQGGTVSGIVAPGPRLVADPPVADLQPLAKPDPADLPNNHLAYAGQWFFFALTALVIYALALRRRRG
jgi:surfeit locus 1 family protein